MARNDILRALFPLRLRQWLGPFLAAGAAAGLFAAIVIGSGVVDLSASIPHPTGWAEFLHYVFKRSVAHHGADFTPPGDQSATPIAKGAMMFDSVCANCHSTPGRGQSLVALSMRPQPQYLPGVVNELSDRELFWILKNGVKYSAMPSWPTQRRDDEVWAMVAFVRQLPTMTGPAYDALVATARPAAPTAGPSVAPPVSAKTARTPADAVPVGTRPNTQAISQVNTAYPAAGFGGERIGGNPQALCAGCHGGAGNSPRSGGIPALGLLDPETIRSALVNYASGQRASGFMQPIAAQLSPAQIDQLANQLGHDRAAHGAMTPTPNDPQLLALGAAIASNGIAATRVAACQTCHDISKATDKLYPAIVGQDWRYLRDQLRLYRDGNRHAPSVVRPMAAEALHLTDREIDAVTAWYATQQPMPPAAVAEAGRAARPPNAGKMSDLR